MNFDFIKALQGLSLKDGAASAACCRENDFRSFFAEQGVKELYNVSSKKYNDIITTLYTIYQDKSKALYCYVSELDLETRKIFELSYMIPSKDTQNIIFFYLDDYYYCNKFNIKKLHINDFVSRARRNETLNTCNICEHKIPHVIICSECTGVICSKCYMKLKDNKCPYCRHKYKLK